MTRMTSDLCHTRQAIDAGTTDATAQIELSVAAAQSVACEAAFLATTFDEARAAAASPIARQGPLAGLAVSIKDLFDVAGQPTRAASRVLRQPSTMVEKSRAEMHFGGTSKTECPAPNSTDSTSAIVS